MKDNLKVFYSFINKQRNRRIEVGPFIKDEKFIYDGKEISNCLKTEFTSQMNKKPIEKILCDLMKLMKRST